MLAYTDADRGFLRLRHLGPSEEDRLLAPFIITGPLIWSRDSNEVTTALDDSGVFRIVRFDLQGEAHDLWSETSSKRYVPIGYFPDGRLLCRVREGSGAQQLISLPENLSGQDLPEIAATARTPQLSPDGKYLVYSDSAQFFPHIFLQRLDVQEAPRQLTNHPSADQAPTWSWGGRHIFFIRGWASDPKQSIHALQFSERSSQVFEISSVPENFLGRGFSVSISGELFIAGGRETATVGVVGWDPLEGQPNSVSRFDFPDFSYFWKWTLDNRIIFNSPLIAGATQTEGPVQMVRRPEGSLAEFFRPTYQNKPPIPFPDRFTIQAYRPGHDWGIAVERMSNEIFRFDTQTGQVEFLAQLPEAIRRVRIFEGTQVLISTYSQERNLWTIYNVSAIDGTWKRLGTSRLTPFPIWSPDERELAFSDANCLMVASAEGDRLETLYCAPVPPQASRWRATNNKTRIRPLGYPNDHRLVT